MRSDRSANENFGGSRHNRWYWSIHHHRLRASINCCAGGFCQ